MKTLQECQAEVFRRSEIRIQEHKKRRKHIAMLCVPLVLCLVLCSTFLLPKRESCPMPHEDTLQKEPGYLYAGAGGIDMECFFVESVEVSGDGISYSFTAPEKVQGILELINTIVNTTETTVITGEKWSTSDTYAGGNGVQYSMAPDGNLSNGTNGQNVYEITVTQADGAITEYLLIGSMLCNRATGEMFHLNEVTDFALRDVLGLLSD